MSRILTFIAVIVLVAAAFASAADLFRSHPGAAARFQKHQQQRIGRRRNAPVRAGGVPTLLFSRNTGAEIYTTPFAVGSNLFVGNAKGQLVNIHRATGLTNWTFTATVPSKDDDQQDRIYAQPALAASNQALFVADSTGTLYNIDLDAGAVDYTFDLNLDPVMAKPLVVGTSNVVVATYGGQVFNFNIAGDGSQAWNYTVGDFVSADPLVALAGDGSPIIIIPAHDGNVHALDGNTGKLLYKAATLNNNAIENSCVQDSARFIYCNANGGEVFKMNSTSGEFAWKVRVSGSGAARPVLSADGSAIYFPADFTKMFSLKTETGSVNWQFDAKDFVLQSAAAVNPNNGNVIFAGQTPFTSTTPGTPTIFAVDATSGQQIWTISNGTTGDQVSTGVYVDSNIIAFGTQQGALMAFSNQ